MSTLTERSARVERLPLEALRPNRFSLSIYGNPSEEADRDGLFESVRNFGILVPLVVAPEPDGGFEVISGHRRLACAQVLGLDDVPCLVRPLPRGSARKRAVIDYNRQRRKTFSQMMLEADALERLIAPDARRRREANLEGRAERRNSDARTGRTDETVAKAIGLGGKDLYRQARKVWSAARGGDPRARDAIRRLDDGSKTVHAAYKDLRRRDHFQTGFRPTPYDVWRFRIDRAHGLPHPGSIPAAIVAHTLHYFSQPGDLVVDPMAGGGTTLDVAEAMGRRCLAYDLAPVRHDIRKNDVKHGLPSETGECALVFCDPPYHTMLAGAYADLGAPTASLDAWIAFLRGLARAAFASLRPGGHIALLLGNQTEKDLPAGHGYLDHAFLGYQALLEAGFLPQRRISCPMDGAYQPQQVQRARAEGRLLGQVRDLLVMSKPAEGTAHPSRTRWLLFARSEPPGGDQENGSPPASS